MKTGRCGGQAFVPGHPQPLQMGGGVPERNLLAQVQVHMLRTRPRDVLGEILIGQSQSESTWLPALRPRTQLKTLWSELPGLGAPVTPALGTCSQGTRQPGEAPGLIGVSQEPSANTSLVSASCHITSPALKVPLSNPRSSEGATRDRGGGTPFSPLKG